MKHIAQIILVIIVFVGIVIAKGFWSTLMAIVFPAWALYLFAELIVSRIL